MNKQEQAIMRIKESLNEFPDNRMAQQVTSEDLRILIRLEKRKNSPTTYQERPTQCCRVKVIQA